MGLKARPTNGKRKFIPRSSAGIRLDRRQFRLLLARHRGNVSSVAREIGRSRVFVHKWIRRYEIEMDDLRVRTPAAPPEMRFDPDERRTLRSARRSFEAWYVRRVLDTCGGNRQEATEWLDISLSSLKDKLREGADEFGDEDD